MRGCLMAVLFLLGIALLLPGLCFVSIGHSLGSQSNPGTALVGAAVVMIAAAILVGVFSRGD